MDILFTYEQSETKQNKELMMTLSREIKMKGEFKSVKHEALLNIVKTANVVQKRSNVFFSEFGLTDAQYNVLIVLNLEGAGLTQVEIGKRVIASRSNITALIDRLEKSKYVKRSNVEGDRRVFNVELASEGKKLLDKIEKKYVDEVEQVMGCFTEKESKQISQLMVKLRQHSLS